MKVYAILVQGNGRFIQVYKEKETADSDCRILNNRFGKIIYYVEETELVGSNN